MNMATAVFYERCVTGNTGIERILHGLLLPKSVEMALMSNIDPLESTLAAYDILQTCTASVFLRFHMALEDRNARIIEADRQRWLQERERARHTADSGRARGTRSTRKHRKQKAGQR